MPEERKYRCESIEDALAMLEAVEEFLKKHEELQRKLNGIRERLLRLSGAKPRSFGYGGGYRSSRLESVIEEMAEQAMADAMERFAKAVRAKYSAAEAELSPEEEREIDQALEKFAQAKKEVEEAEGKS